jgi:hypothetical protein
MAATLHRGGKRNLRVTQFGERHCTKVNAEREAKMEEQQKELSVLNRVRLVSAHLEVSGLQRVDQDKAWVLLAAALLGPDAERIAKELDLEEGFVRKIERRMRASGLWSEGRVYTEDWVIEGLFDRFYEHLAVASGLLTAFPSPEGFEYVWAREQSSL